MKQMKSTNKNKKNLLQTENGFNIYDLEKNILSNLCFLF